MHIIIPQLIDKKETKTKNKNIYIRKVNNHWIKVDTNWLNTILYSGWHCLSSVTEHVSLSCVHRQSILVLLKTIFLLYTD